MQMRLFRTVAGATLLMLPFAACGGGSSTSGGSTSGADVTVHAQDSLKFDKSDYSAKTGDIKIAYVGDGSLTHTLLIKDKSGFKLQVSHDTKTGTVNLAPGTYTLYCDIPGHESAGMKATLTVS
ncbi:MAG TPA: plastocyanin/azurin family copper-binding protein [Acidimicrobiales bacterium]|nr:plastocyanin/azurin family copper-binding protein [Acidimicrobiales bacterium]